MNTQHSPQGIMPSGHTPGPWMTEADYRDGSPYLIYAEGSIKIADLRASTPAESPETDAEFDANARIIAAAPELLEALELAAKLVSTARRHFPKSIKHSDRFELELVSAQINKVMDKATSQP